MITYSKGEERVALLGQKVRRTCTIQHFRETRRVLYHGVSAPGVRAIIYREGTFHDNASALQGPCGHVPAAGRVGQNLLPLLLFFFKKALHGYLKTCGGDYSRLDMCTVKSA